MMSNRRLSDSARMGICLLLFVIGLPCIVLVGRFGLGLGAQPQSSNAAEGSQNVSAASQRDVISPGMIMQRPNPSKPVGKMRIWTEAGDITKIKAMVIDFDGKRVTLRRQNGKTAWFPLERLSDDDVKYVKKLYNQ